MNFCLDIKNIMTVRDMRQAAKLLQTEWNLGKRESGATGDICAWIYLMEILEETEKMVIQKDGNRLIGFAGYSNKHSSKHLLKKRLYRLIKNRLYNSPKIIHKEAFREYHENYNYLPEELVEYFDGEISILIVDQAYRGKGIGKKLLSDVFLSAQKDGMKNIQILTDESCNVSFYEAIGCSKVYETIVANNEKGKLGETCTEKAFVYEKWLA